MNEVCVSGACVSSSGGSGCGQGLMNCNDNCIDPLSDNDNCGTCSNTCDAGTSCIHGNCVNLLTDPDNCGSANHVCSEPTPDCCHGTCTSIHASDVSNCGGCGTPCSNVEGVLCCSGVCKLGASDPLNCNTCGNVCSFPHGVASCVAGVCTLAGCVSGYANCDEDNTNGCETDISNDSNNCGGCNRICPIGSYCAGGSCVCRAGYSSCDGAGW